MIGFLKPAPAKPELPADQIDPTYRRLRWQVFFGIFFGYAAYYFVRSNFDLAQRGLIEAGLYNKAELGIIGIAPGLAYGLSKFLMGAVSDRSGPKKFLPLGLALSGLCMTLMGLMPWATSGILIMFVMLFLNGWFQGMGWPPCGRSMVYWWSKKERGTIVSIWNTAHNFGGIVPPLLVGLASTIYAANHPEVTKVTFGHVWQEALYYPGIAAMIASIVVFFVMKDSPQSCGLPPIEVYKNDYPEDYDEKTNEKPLSTKEIFVTYVLKNRLLWYIAIANIFVYLIRYGILKWSPVYLGEVKHFNIKATASAYGIYEFAAIPGTLFCGWVSDKIFKGRRGLTGLVFMALVTVAVAMFWLNPATPDSEIAHYETLPWYQNPYQLMDFIYMTIIGFLIYGPVMLIGLHALELVPKNAAGTAAGFTGLFGYLGGSVAASAIIGWAAEKYGWDGGFYIMIGGSILACVLLLITMVEEGKHKAKLTDHYGK
ncbi:glycerol-3-phosphate transporter [Mergibacter septicus]|uniref:glycerol-3-phosphate transporter n=1 Tax=Mergibacter septicus TaxID=221402 RepID=UPI001178E5E9|nr:glycerol-3-phosphate transporter [Mergibacter septicus]AWX14308.1 glycerol-3-phosphate transporter [Mergibacter septicus]